MRVLWESAWGECAVIQGPGNSGTEVLVEHTVEDRDCTRTVSQEADGQYTIRTESEGHKSGLEYRCARAGQGDVGFQQVDGLDCTRKDAGHNPAIQTSE